MQLRHSGHYDSFNGQMRPVGILPKSFGMRTTSIGMRKFVQGIDATLLIVFSCTYPHNRPSRSGTLKNRSQELEEFQENDFDEEGIDSQGNHDDEDEGEEEDKEEKEDQASLEKEDSDEEDQDPRANDDEEAKIEVEPEQEPEQEPKPCLEGDEVVTVAESLARKGLATLLVQSTKLVKDDDDTPNLNGPIDRAAAMNASKESSRNLAGAHLVRASP